MRSLVAVCLQAGIILISVCGAMAETPDITRKSAPGVIVRPLFLDFGTVNTGQQRQLKVMLYNHNTAPVSIPTAYCTSQFSVLPNTNLKISPNDSLMLVVTFSPIDTGFITGLLSMPTGEAVQLTGVGTGEQYKQRFAVSPAQLSLGNVSTADGVRSDTLLITNTGRLPLRISRCIARYPQASLSLPVGVAIELQPGEVRQVLMYFEPTIPGRVEFNLEFSHNGSRATDFVPVSMTVVGDTLAPFYAVNRRSVDFGRLQTGIRVTDSVVVYNIGERDLHLVTVQTSADFTYRWFNSTIAPGASRAVYIELNPKNPIEYNGWIRIRHDGWNGQLGSDSIPLHATAVGESVNSVCSLSKKSVDFGFLTPGEVRTDTVYITNTGTDALRFYTVNLVSGSPTFVKGTTSLASLQPGEARAMPLTYSPIKFGASTGMVVISHNAKNSRDTVFLTGACDSGIDDAVATFSDTLIAMGWVDVDSIKSVAVTVSNIGRRTLTITNARSSHPWLTVSPDSATIQPLRSVLFTLRFLPSDSGAVSAAVEFLSNATSPKHRVHVTATAAHFVRLSGFREAPPGALFAFEGVISRCMGTHTRLQDSTAGITIHHPSGPLFTDVANHVVGGGIKLRVAARVSKKRNLTMVAADGLFGYEILNRGHNIPVPNQVLSLSQIAARGEDYESEYVTLFDLSIVTDEQVFRAHSTYDLIDQSDQSKRVKLALEDSADSYYARLWIWPKIIGRFSGVVSQDSEDPAGGYLLLPIEAGDLLDEGDGFETAPATALLGTYPHPLRQTGTISYSLAEAGRVHLRVVDALGREVRTLVSNDEEAGVHRAGWSGNDKHDRRLATGVYFLDLRVTDYSARLLHHSVKPILLQR